MLSLQRANRRLFALLLLTLVLVLGAATAWYWVDRSPPKPPAGALLV